MNCGDMARRRSSSMRPERRCSSWPDRAGRAACARGSARTRRRRCAMPHQLLDDRRRLPHSARGPPEIVGLRFQRFGQRQRILEGQPRARADRVMRGVQRVADQHHVAERPALVPDPRKIAPDRAVGDQRVSVQRVGEHLLADRRGCSSVCVEAGAARCGSHSTMKVLMGARSGSDGR